MEHTQRTELNDIENLQLKVSDSWSDYWSQYSDFGTWQFWINLAFLIIPLIVLYIFMDKRKALLLGFFGFNVHVWFTYIDTYGGTRALWYYPYKLLPVLPISFALDVSLVPVSYMLLYQWALNNKKNYYLFMLILSALFSFVLKPLLISLDLFELNRGANYFHLFLGYVAVGIVSKLITNLFLYFEHKAKQ
ncbi:CBO0543 family protein [Peribacillus sp. SCS-155]|uniref:CBO0543 family protein n=1 Tax=Peribacillus sedimenti TaxID=3115297 RepID=UPI003905CE88